MEVVNLSNATKKPVILISNDDGIHAEGIEKLRLAISKLGRVVVVAPDRERSAISHAITLHKPLRINKIENDIYSVDGTPADCIMLAVHRILDAPPDLIISGINHGPNLGEDVYYSGTVSAAHEGGIMGIPAFAVSIFAFSPKNLSTASDFSVRLAEMILRDGIPKGGVLNVNVPDMPMEKIKGYRFTRQGKRAYGNLMIEKKDPHGRSYYWIGGDVNGYKSVDGSDCDAVMNGFISITPLKVDMTDEEALKNMRGRSL